MYFEPWHVLAMDGPDDQTAYRFLRQCICQKENKMGDDLRSSEFTGKPQQDPQLDRSAKTGRATQDEQLLTKPTPGQRQFTDTDPWRVFRIIGEFVEGFDTLADLGPAVSIFGSARTKGDMPMYAAAVETTRLLADRKSVV